MSNDYEHFTPEERQANALERIAELLDDRGDAPSKLVSEAGVEEIAQWAKSNGYALVKLPESTLDNDGLASWRVEQEFDLGTVRIRRTDGRADYSGVSTPFRRTDDMRAFAGALLAAADHVDANSPT